MKKLILVQILLTLLFISCINPPSTFPQSQPASNLAHSASAPLDCSQDQSSALPQEQANPFIANLNTLGIDLYHLLTQGEKATNLIFSPYGIVAAFSMAYGGARQETEAEMAQVLHFLPQADQHAQFHMMNCYLTNLANQVDATPQANDTTSDTENDTENIPFQLQLANGLWSQANFPFAQSYFATIGENYNADLQTVDFAANPIGAIQQINQWVDQKTAGRIQEFMTKEEVTPETRLVLANAIYFKASWLRPFLPSATQAQAFTLLNGEMVAAPLMHGFIRAPYLKANGYQAALLPYVGEKVDLLILLPDAGHFAEIEQNLDLATLSAIATNAQPHDITLALPTFTLQTKVDLSKTLQAAGLHTPFDSVKANFAGMTESKNGFYISAALQQATITVDEKGTEAAAATGVVMAVAGIERAELIVDRPFIYAIWAREAKAILFMGRVMNPTE